MARLIVSEFMSLDGVVEAPGGEPTHPHAGWVFDFMGEEQMQYKLQEVLDAGSLLIGRVTYEGFSAAWPEQSAGPEVSSECVQLTICFHGVHITSSSTKSMD